MTSFHQALRDIDTAVYTNPEQVDRLAEQVKLAAQELARDYFAYPPDAAGILFDGGEDGWEEMAYLPVTGYPDRKAALREARRLAKQCEAEPGFYVAVERTIPMAPVSYIHGDGDWAYWHCDGRSHGAVDFWVAELVERRVSLRRALYNWRLAFRNYRRTRKQGKSRWQSTWWLRNQLISWRLKRHWRQLRKRLAGKGASA